MQRRFREYPLVLEVRQASWDEPQILDLLAELSMGLCNIDQTLFKRSVKPYAEAASRIGYVRLYGRNYVMISSILPINWSLGRARKRDRRKDRGGVCRGE